jgi:hypothetical protein
MVPNITSLLSFATSLRSLTQQIDKLAKQGFQSGSQNPDNFSAVLNRAREAMATGQPAQSLLAQTTSSPSAKPEGQCPNPLAQATECRCASSANTATAGSAQLPPYLAALQPRYEADTAYWSAVEAQQRASWQTDAEALEKLQETYHPSVKVRQEACAWLEEHRGVYWHLSAPHVMETGKLLNSPLPGYLQADYPGYQQMTASANADSLRVQTLWTQNPEALRKLQETYHPDAKVRREAMAWLEENISPYWRATAPNVMETGKLLAALGEPGSSLAA